MAVGEWGWTGGLPDNSWDFEGGDLPPANMKGKERKTKKKERENKKD